MLHLTRIDDVEVDGVDILGFQVVHGHQEVQLQNRQACAGEGGMQR